MKKIAFISAALLSLNVFSQNIIQQVSNVSLIQTNYNQRQQVFASNMMVNENNANKPARVNANPSINVQRASNVNGRQQQRRRVVNAAPVIASNINPPIVNVAENNTDEIQQLINYEQQAQNNSGNAPDSYRDGNENLIEQIASVNIPAIQTGNASMNLNLEIPTLKLPTLKFASRKTVTNSKRKTFKVKNRLAKLNRNLAGKLAFKKKLKIKVDNCFKW